MEDTNKEKERFLNKLKEKADQAAKVGAELGKKAMEKGPGLSKELRQEVFQSIENVIGAGRKGLLSSSERLEVLKKLAELKDAGVISEQEFEGKKKEILERI